MLGTLPAVQLDHTIIIYYACVHLPIGYTLVLLLVAANCSAQGNIQSSLLVLLSLSNQIYYVIQVEK